MEKRDKFEEPFDLSSVMTGGGFEEALTKVVSGLSNRNSVRMFTELTSREILALVTLSLYNGNRTINGFIDEYCAFKVSLLRKSRGEYVTLGRAFGEELKEERRGLLSRIQSRFGH